MNDLHHSYNLCKKITKKEAKNFYYGFLPLPRVKRHAIYALYAYMRRTDDIVDNTTDLAKARQDLNAWRENTRETLAGNIYNHPIMPAFADTIKQFNIPHHYFFELIDGVEMDLRPRRFNQFPELHNYCYRVASVVGLCCLSIYGYEGDDAKAFAIDCGIAFQLTNILRDLKEDSLRNRVYIPQEDFERFGYSETSLKEGNMNAACIEMITFEITRAKNYFEKGKQLIPKVHRDCRTALRTLIHIYEGLLHKLEMNKNEILKKRITLSIFEKIKILVMSFLSIHQSNGR